MLAMECSNPAATKAAMGGTMTATLPTTLRAPKLIQTARHTSTLQRMPRKKASRIGNCALAVAMARAVLPTAPSPSM